MLIQPSRRDLIRYGIGAAAYQKMAHGQALFRAQNVTVGSSAISLNSSTAKGSANGTDVTSDAIVTTGAGLIVLAGSNFGGAGDVTFQDSKSNTWSLLTLQKAGAGDFTEARFAYCVNPTVGSGHTFDALAILAPSIFVMAFNLGAAYDSNENGANGTSGTSGACGGGITPSQDNCVVVTFMANTDGTGTVAPTGYTIPSGMTIPFDSGNCYAGSMAYKIQTSATATDPSWSWTNSASHAQVLAAWRKA